VETDVDSVRLAGPADRLLMLLLLLLATKSATMTDEVASSCRCGRRRVPTDYNNRQNVTFLGMLAMRRRPGRTSPN